MKKRLSLSLFLLFCLCACHKPKAPAVGTLPADYQKASSFLYKQNDSAFYYFNKVAANPKDSLQTATAYYYMGFIQAEAGDYFGGQESLSMSLKYLDEDRQSDFPYLSSTSNELGLTCLSLKDWDAALAFFEQAVYFSKDEKSRLSFLNNKALAYQKKGNYPAAIRIYKLIIGQVTEREVYARVLSNMARTRWLLDKKYNAAPELLKALRLRQLENDRWGQNASYAHLADYYVRSKPDSALLYAGKMYAIARQLESPDDQLEALQKLIGLSPSEKTKDYFTRYQQLNDSMQTARNAAKNQFALIRYDVEKRKADNLRLQQDNAEKKYQLIRHRLLLAGTVLLAVAGAATGVFWYLRRKRRLEIAAEDAIRESKLKTSRKVHDVVANGLYRIMSEVENQEEVDKESLLDHIEVLYEQSRDISYERHEVAAEFFDDMITQVLTSFSEENTRVAVAGNTPDIWKGTSAEVRSEVVPILQELMVNMRKHSRAGSVAVRFERKDGLIHIYYADNGIGLPADVRYGNGLTNTGNRIKAIGGRVTFDAGAQNGLRIQLTFPPA